MSSTAVALLIASLALVAIQFALLRSSLIEDLRLHAKLVAANAATALLFDDRASAAEGLAALRAVPYIRSATLVDNDHLQLAVYERDGKVGTPPVSAELIARGHRYELGTIVLAERIDYRGSSVGSIVLEAGLGRLYGRLAAYAGVMALVAALSLAVTRPLVARLRQQVSKAEERLERLAHVDAVTGLPNRNAFTGLLRRMLGRAPTQGGRVVLALLDLDNFKMVNDTLGHAQGDELLKAIARRLSSLLRGSDICCRIGGDEFALILTPMNQEEDVTVVAQRILRELSRPLQLGVQEFHVTASMGTSVYPLDAQDVHTLVRNADTAMYHAKHHGKNGCAAFQPVMNLRAQRRLELEADMHRALERGEFRLHYQPMVDLPTGGIVGVEALLRWPHPQRGLIPPDEFVPVAEECGLIMPIGRWVLRAACRQAAEWRAQGLSVPVLSVNVSVRQFHHEQLLQDIEAALAESGLEPQRLELEITESLLMESAEANTVLLRRLRERGIRLAIDDFGIGHSSLAYLPSFPVDTIKIDRSFLERIPGDGSIITSAILALGRSFRLNVVAEGVERREQLDFLRAAGCEVAQGWYFAKAIPPADFARLLAQGGFGAAGREFSLTA